jgi:hypothetical protein
MEARMEYRPCKYMDSDGYCTRHFVFASERLEGIDCRKGVVRGVVDVEVCYPSILHTGCSACYARITHQQRVKRMKES